MFQPPARYTRPLSDDFVTDGDLLIELAEVAWLTPESGGKPIVLDEWQKWLLRHILERYPADYPDPTLAGRLRYRQCVVSVPRQVGKSVLGGILAGLYGLLLHEQGAAILSLASSVEQAQIIYDRVVYAIRNNPFLGARFKRATDTRGIITTDGSGKYQVRPAKESALQGYPLTLGLVDELHIIKPGMWSAAIQGAQSKRDGIIIGITTAGDESSKTLIDLYQKGEKAIAGDASLERFGFFCWEAPTGSAIDDPEAIMTANPAVRAGRIPLENVLASVATMPEHEARRYVLNQFVSGTSESWLPGNLLALTASNGITEVRDLVLSVDMTNKREHATIAATVKRPDGVFETELIAGIRNPDDDKLFDELSNLYLKHSAVAIALDDTVLHSLGRRLLDRGLPVYKLWRKEVSAASNTAYSLFASNSIRHANDPLFLYQSSRAVAKYTGETWTISRRESLGDIDAVMATVMGIYVASIRNTNSLQVF